MSVTCGFFNAIAGDRKYDAEHFSQLFDGILTDGVFASVGDLFKVEPGDGLQVLVYPGRAWLKGTWTLNDAIFPLDLELPDVSLNRIDAVVLECNHSDTVRNNTIKILTGTPGTTPQKPTLTNTDLIAQLPLAYITIAPNNTSISASQIEIMVGKSTCPFVTGILSTVNIDMLFEQWDDEFNTWFESVQDVLDDNTATQLFQLVSEKLDKVADKATEAEAIAGVNNDKYMTPALVKKSVYKVGDVLKSYRNVLVDDASFLVLKGTNITTTNYPELTKLVYDKWYTLNVNNIKLIPQDTSTGLSIDYYVYTIWKDRATNIYYLMYTSGLKRPVRAFQITDLTNCTLSNTSTDVTTSSNTIFAFIHNGKNYYMWYDSSGDQIYLTNYTGGFNTHYQTTSSFLEPDSSASSIYTEYRGGNLHVIICGKTRGSTAITGFTHFTISSTNNVTYVSISLPAGAPQILFGMSGKVYLQGINQYYDLDTRTLSPITGTWYTTFKNDYAALSGSYIASRMISPNGKRVVVAIYTSSSAFDFLTEFYETSSGEIQYRKYQFETDESVFHVPTENCGFGVLYDDIETPFIYASISGSGVCKNGKCIIDSSRSSMAPFSNFMPVSQWSIQNYENYVIYLKKVGASSDPKYNATYSKMNLNYMKLPKEDDTYIKAK